LIYAYQRDVEDLVGFTPMSGYLFYSGGDRRRATKGIDRLIRGFPCNPYDISVGLVMMLNDSHRTCYLVYSTHLMPLDPETAARKARSRFGFRY